MAGDIDTLLLDKTGTITIGNRKATQFVPLGGMLDRATWPGWPAWPRWPTTTPEGKSIVELARQQVGRRRRGARRQRASSSSPPRPG